MPTPKAAVEPAIAPKRSLSSPPRTSGGRERPARRANDQPRPCEDAEHAGLQQRLQPLVVENVSVLLGPLVNDPCAVALSEEQRLLRLVQRRARDLPVVPLPSQPGKRLLFGDDASAREECVLERADSAGKDEVDDDRRQPGSAARAARRHAALRRRNTATIVAPIMIVVREIDASAPSVTRAQSAHHSRFRVFAAR